DSWSSLPAADFAARPSKLSGHRSGLIFPAMPSVKDDPQGVPLYLRLRGVDPPFQGLFIGVSQQVPGVNPALYSYEPVEGGKSVVFVIQKAGHKVHGPDSCSP